MKITNSFVRCLFLIFVFFPFYSQSDATQTLGFQRASFGGATLFSAPSTVRSLINKERTKKGLRPLQNHGQCGQVAKKHASFLTTHQAKKYRHHRFAERVSHFATRSHKGENVAYTGTGLDPAKAVRLWMNSAPHRREMLRPGNQSVGIGVAKASNGRIFYVACFVGG